MLNRGRRLAEKGPMEHSVQNVHDFNQRRQTKCIVQLLNRIDTLSTLHETVLRAIEGELDKVRVARQQQEALERSIKALEEYCLSENERTFKNEAEINVSFYIELFIKEVSKREALPSLKLKFRDDRAFYFPFAGIRIALI